VVTVFNKQLLSSSVMYLHATFDLQCNTEGVLKVLMKH